MFFRPTACLDRVNAGYVGCQGALLSLPLIVLALIYESENINESNICIIHLSLYISIYIHKEHVSIKYKHCAYFSQHHTYMCTGLLIGNSVSETA